MAKKIPSWKTPPADRQKQPKGLDKAANFDEANFKWRTNWIDLDGPWGFQHADHDCTWKQLIPRLHQYEDRTWGEIFGGKSTSDHPMPVHRTERLAQQRLKDIGKSDFDTLYQINIRGKIRLWGIRDRGIFYVMWYDPNHTVYIQVKK